MLYWHQENPHKKGPMGVLHWKNIKEMGEVVWIEVKSIDFCVVMVYNNNLFPKSNGNVTKRVGSH